MVIGVFNPFMPGDILDKDTSSGSMILMKITLEIRCLIN